jgi:hypothetical protein
LSGCHFIAILRSARAATRAEGRGATERRARSDGANAVMRAVGAAPRTGLLDLIRIRPFLDSEKGVIVCARHACPSSMHDGGLTVDTSSRPPFQSLS